MDQLGMSSSVHWYDLMLMREDGYVFIRALQFEDERQRMKGRLN